MAWRDLGSVRRRGELRLRRGRGGCAGGVGGFALWVGLAGCVRARERGAMWAYWALCGAFVEEKCNGPDGP